MTAIIRRSHNGVMFAPFYRPTRLMEELETMAREMWDSWRPTGFGTTFTHGLDVYRENDELVVKAEVPGVEAEGLNIDINEESLIIKGETKTEEEIKQEDYYRRECRYGTLTRSVPLPAGLNIDKAGAELENGILTVTIPKSPSAKPKVVKVKAKQKAEINSRQRWTGNTQRYEQCSLAVSAFQPGSRGAPEIC